MTRLTRDFFSRPSIALCPGRSVGRALGLSGLAVTAFLALAVAPGSSVAAPPPPPGAAVPPPPPAGEGAPSAGSVGAATVVAEAEEKYRDGDYESAAVDLFKVSSGQVPSNPSEQQRAQFWLGKALYNLGFYSASLAIFDEIVKAGPSHQFHRLTLPWLASLAQKLPEGAGVLEKIGTYQVSDLDDEAFNEVRDELVYLLGRYFYHKADLGQGVALLGQVPQESDFYIPAQYFLGVAHTREFKGEPAVAAFKNVLRRSLELQEQDSKKAQRARKKKAAKSPDGAKRKRSGKKKKSTEMSFSDEMRQYEHLAAFGMSNVFYMIGKFDTAIKYLDKIPLDSKYWLDAMFWAAWHEFRKVEVDPENSNNHYQRTLGYVHTVEAPFFEEYLYPETLKLKAVTYYFNCRYESAKQAIDEFNRKYPRTKAALESILAEAPEDFQLYELADKIRSEDSGLDPFVEQVAFVSMQDRLVDKYFAYVDELVHEAAMLEGDVSDDFRGSGVGERVGEDLDAAISLAKEAAGAIARQRITSAVNEIKELEREMIKVEYEILEKRKQQGALEAIPPKPQKPKIDSEHEIYRYNGEYWQDELGYYRYKVTSLCKD